MVYLVLKIIPPAAGRAKGVTALFSHEEIQSLNTLEMSVYNYVSKNREKVIYMKIRELAAQAHVSTTTVLHMCKKFGCEGYTEFKLLLKQELLKDKKDIADLDISALQDYLNRLALPASQALIDQAVQVLRTADQLLFIGVGTSATLARYGARYFCNVGYFSTFVDDPFTPIAPCTTNHSRTVVIALSVSGETQQVIDMARQLKERLCPLISITNSSSCTLAQISDLNFNYYMTDLRIQDVFQLTSQVPVICLLEILGRRLYQSRMDEEE